MTQSPKTAVAATAGPGSRTALSVLIALTFSHLLNDTMQSVIPAIYPLLKTAFALSFAQIGLITFVNQVTASLLQPLVGWYTDKWPKPFSLAIGMAFTLAGLILLALAGMFPLVLVAVALIGMGSSIFHPEASRIARLASGGRYGFAQSLFQVGGNTGTSFGPLLAALLIIPCGRRYVLWVGILALIGIYLLTRIGYWYRSQTRSAAKQVSRASSTLPRRRVIVALGVLIALVFSKYFYLSSMTNYYTFFLIQRFHMAKNSSEPQLFLFIFLFAVALGTFAGGPLGDRFGRKKIIWASIFGTFPFTLLLPYANLPWTAVLSFIIGAILASAFSAILVFAQELVPGRVGTIAGLFFGLAFGLGGISSALLGALADRIGIISVYHICAFLPLLGMLAWLLPDMEEEIPAMAG